MPTLWERFQSNKPDGEPEKEAAEAPQAAPAAAAAPAPQKIEKPSRARPAPFEPYTFEARYDLFGEDGRTVVGTETWKLHATAHGITGVSLIQIQQPQPQTRHVRMSLSHKWEWQNLSIRVEGGAQIMLGFEGERVTGHFKGATGLRPINESWMPWYEIDFHSPIFNTIAVARMALATGESESLKVYYLDRETLLPEWMTQIYNRAEHVPSPAFPRQPLIHYTMDFGGKGERFLHMWVNEQGIVWHFRGAFKLQV